MKRGYVLLAKNDNMFSHVDELKNNDIKMAKIISSVSRVDRPSTKRPGVHAKKKTSRLKSSKNYKKPYRGQGRA